MNKNKDRIRADKEVIRQLHISIATADKEFEDRKIQVRKSSILLQNFSIRVDIHLSYDESLDTVFTHLTTRSRN